MTAKDDKSSHKDAIKATTLFGGVQVFNIIIRILRAKAISVLLGPSGMGVAGLFRSTLETISAFTNLGLGQSAVRNIAEASGANDERKVATTITVFRRIIWVTGIVGALVCALCSPYISQLTFGSKNYTFAFLILSISILLMQLTSGQTALLQGLRKYRHLAQANVYGSLVGLFFTIPLYYIWGVDAVVPVLLLTYITAYLCAKHFAKKINIVDVDVSKNEYRTISFDMIKLGFVLSLQGFLTLLSSYIVRIYIRQNGGLEDVGLYNAGFTIVNTYIGMIFTAMATDYYPRLASCVRDMSLFKQTINNQTEVVFLLMTPMIVLFMVFIRPAVVILYSSKFLPVEGMIYWAMIAMIFKAMAWGLSFGLVSKGDIKTYSICEFSVIVYGLLFNIVGYKYLGLKGLGVSYFFMYAVYFIHLYIVSKKHMSFSYSKSVVRHVMLAIVFLSSILFLNYLVGYVKNESLQVFIKYFAGSLLCSVAILVYYKKLSRIVPIKDTFKKLLNRNK